MKNFTVSHFGSKLTKSCASVLQALSSSQFLTQEQIISITGLSERTVKSVVKALVSNNIVHEEQNFRDMRKKIYKFNGVLHV